MTTRTYRESGAGPEEPASAVDTLLGPAAIADLARRELERAERYRRVLSLAVIELPAGDAREAALAARLGISTDALGWLGMRTRPDPAAPDFAREVRRLADTFRCDADLLTAILSA